MPRETRSHKREAQVVTVDHHARHEATVPVAPTRLDCHSLSEHARRRKLLGPRAEVLAVLGAVDPVNANREATAVPQHRQGVAIHHTDHAAAEWLLSNADKREGQQRRED